MAAWRKAIGSQLHQAAGPSLIGLPFDRAADFAQEAADAEAWTPAADLCLAAITPAPSDWVKARCRAVAIKLKAAGQGALATRLDHALPPSSN